MKRNSSPWQEKVSLKKFSFDKPESYELDQSCPSVQNLLKELETNLEESHEKGEERYLQLSLLLKRRSETHYGDYLLFEGNIQGLFHAPCVRCLVPAKCPLNVDFSACFLSDCHEDKDEYQDMTSIYIDGQERELYFHHNGIANLQEIIHENIFINIDPLPLHHPDCRGICPVCGINLNTATCSH